MSDYTSQKSGKLMFGLWAVGRAGSDAFGERVRNTFPTTPRVRNTFPTTPRVRKLDARGADGVNLHNNDLVPFGATLAKRNAVVKELKQALTDRGWIVPTATTSPFLALTFRGSSVLFP